ncbi:MAG TPA: DUF1501 domain-containing protein [Kiritimatiellia bacterium]|nr:DUF1501 domain-containing protein [Kiritimatiellia bacterium]
MSKRKATLQTRREFLRTSLVGGALTWSIPLFLQSTMRSLAANALGSSIQVERGRDGNILVVLQLAGGNDGLNTLVPITNDHYYKARPRLALPPGNTLKISGEHGLHPAMSGLRQIFDDGQLAIIQGVGYPNPNRSHFRSMEIWQTATDSNRTAAHGWIGRYFDNACSGCPSTTGICIGNETPAAFLSQSPIGITFRNPSDYQLATSQFSMTGTGPEDDLFRELNMLGANPEFSGSSIEGLSGRSRPNTGESPIDFLERTALNAQVTSEQVRKISESASLKKYPDSELGRDFELVSKLIRGGMDTRVYYLSHGGFDTHVNQGGAHDRLLRQFSDALRVFLADMKESGNLDRVTVMTFSEFGRRVAENANQGTDHGAAAPVFIAGGRVRPGIHGEAPSLSPKKLDRGDLVHTVDFRQIYAGILEQHLHADSRKILGRAFAQARLYT